MPSVREQILARMQAALLAGSTPAGANVFRSRETSITRAISPAIVIMPDTEDGTPFGDDLDKNEFYVKVDIFARGDPWDSLADPTATAAHEILLTDAQLAALAVRIRKRQSTWEGEEADRTAGVLAMRYHVQYLTKATDISAAP